MRKQLFLLAVACLMLCMPSCSDDGGDDIPPVLPEVWPELTDNEFGFKGETFEVTAAFESYGSDYADATANREIHLEIVDENSDFSLYFIAFVDPMYTRLAQGGYSYEIMAREYEPGTFNYGRVAIVRPPSVPGEDPEVALHRVNWGGFTVSEEDGVYTIEVKCKVPGGDKLYGRYVGPLEFQTVLPEVWPELTDNEFCFKGETFEVTAAFESYGSDYADATANREIHLEIVDENSDFSLYFIAFVDPMYTRLAQGGYSYEIMAREYEPGTFNYGRVAIVRPPSVPGEDPVVVPHRVNWGGFTVSEEDGVYTIEVKCKVPGGDKLYGRYVGPLEFQNE